MATDDENKADEAVVEEEAADTSSAESETDASESADTSTPEAPDVEPKEDHKKSVGESSEESETVNDAVKELTVKLYDFVHPSHKLNSRLPVLDLINEQLAEDLGANLSAHFHQAVKAKVLSTEFEKFQSYATSLPACINIDQFKMDPLQGSALLILDGNLVFTLVDSFFGGVSVGAKSTQARRFTPTENRIIKHLRENFFKSMSSAWRRIHKIKPNYQTTLSSTQITSPANPAAVVVCIKFEIELNAGKGECHIVIPYSLLEPIRSQLIRNLQKGDDHGVQWRRNFEARVMESRLDIRGVFAESKISVKQLVNLKIGDFIPLGTKKQVQFSANNTPLFDATVGVSNGLASASVVSWHHHKKVSNRN